MALFDKLGSEATLAIIKPEAFQHRQRILDVIAQHNFIVGPVTSLQLRLVQAEEFYAEHAGRPFFIPYTQHMSSGPIAAIMLRNAGVTVTDRGQGVDCPMCEADQRHFHTPAWKRWRDLMGPYTNPPEGTIRAMFGSSVERNAVHGSDSAESALRDLLFFFSLASIINYFDAQHERQANAIGG